METLFLMKYNLSETLTVLPMIIFWIYQCRQGKSKEGEGGGRGREEGGGREGRSIIEQMNNKYSNKQEKKRRLAVCCYKQNSLYIQLNEIVAF